MSTRFPIYGTAALVLLVMALVHCLSGCARQTPQTEPAGVPVQTKDISEYPAYKKQEAIIVVGKVCDLVRRVDNRQPLCTRYHFVVEFPGHDKPAFGKPIPEYVVIDANDGNFAALPLLRVGDSVTIRYVECLNENHLQSIRIDFASRTKETGDK